MKILLITNHFNIGGITNYVLTLARELVALGHQVCVISSGGTMVDQLTDSGIKHFTLNIGTKFFLSWKIFSAVPGIKKIIKDEKIDIIHSHVRVTHFLSWLLSCLTRIPYVITYHGFYKIKLFRRLFPSLGYKTISISDQVSVHIEKEFKFAANNIVTIRNGIDIKGFKMPSQDKIEKKRQEFSCAGKKVVGIISRLADVKGHYFLINAINFIRKDIPNIKLLIFGSGNEEAHLKEQTKRLGLAEHVEFFSSISRSADLFGMFDCFVLPSLDEGLGLAIMEAQSVGLPVVASRTGGILSLVEDRETGLLVDPGNAEQLAEAISLILNDSTLAKYLGEQARKKAEREYGAEKMTREIVEVYENVLNRGEEK